MHTWLERIIQSDMASSNAAEPLWPPAFLETRQRSKSCLPQHTDTSPPFLFLNQMCFYWVQFRVPQRYKYALFSLQAASFQRGDRFFARWLTDWFAGLLTGWNMCLMNSWSTDWLNDWLPNWLSPC